MKGMRRQRKRRKQLLDDIK